MRRAASSEPERLMAVHPAKSPRWLRPDEGLTSWLAFLFGGIIRTQVTSLVFLHTPGHFFRLSLCESAEQIGEPLGQRLLADAR